MAYLQKYLGSYCVFKNKTDTAVINFQVGQINNLRQPGETVISTLSKLNR